VFGLSTNANHWAAVVEAAAHPRFFNVRAWCCVALRFRALVCVDAPSAYVCDTPPPPPSPPLQAAFATRVVGEMRNEGLELNSRAYDALVSVWVRSGDTDKVGVGEMCVLSRSTTHPFLVFAVLCSCDVTTARQANALAERLVESNTPPSAEAFSAIGRAYARAAESEKALALLKLAESAGFVQSLA